MKWRLDLGSFEVYELSNNIKLQQWRIHLPINTGLFLKHSLLWARRPWEKPLIFHWWGATCRLEPGLTAWFLHFSVFLMSSVKNSDHPSSLEMQQRVIYLEVRSLLASPKEDVIRNLGTGRKRWNRKFFHLGRVSHREVLPVLNLLPFT